VFDRAGNYREVEWDFSVVLDGEGTDGDESKDDPLPFILASLGIFILFLFIVVFIVLRRKSREEERRRESRKKRLHKPEKVSIGLSSRHSSRPLPHGDKHSRDLPPTKPPEKVEETGIGEGYIRPKKKKEKKLKRVIEGPKEEEEIPSFMVDSKQESTDADRDEDELTESYEERGPEYERVSWGEPSEDELDSMEPPKETPAQVPEPVWDEDESEDEEWPDRDDDDSDEDRDYGFSHDHITWNENGASTNGRTDKENDSTDEDEIEDLEELEELEDLDEVDDAEEMEIDEIEDDEYLEEWD
jgi:hypothetical protein